MAIKVLDLAKELGVPSDSILEQLHKFYVDAEDENSKVDEKIAALIRIKLGGSKLAAPAKKKEKKPVKAKTVSDKEKAPEVEKETEKKEPVKKEEKLVQEKKLSIQETQEIIKAEKKKEPPQSVPAKKEELEKKAAGPLLEIVEKNERGIFVTKKAKTGPKGKPVIEIVEKGIAARYRPKFSPKESSLRQPVTRETAESEAEKKVSRKTPLKIQLHVPASIRVIAPRINEKPNSIIQYLMSKGLLATINQNLEEDIVRDIMSNFGYELELPKTLETMEEELMAEQHEGSKAALEPRAPVVTFMGHVDHGKTSLLDYIRKTMVTKSEKGGITQHIGAYKVQTTKGSVTFLDTPGHEAFTAMRARGANATDVVVLVVAADDGVMPQTKEAIDHARAADVPIVVAINKCDLPTANPDRVRAELHKEGLMSEQWGGKTVMVEVSAHTGEGVDNLVEMLMLESEMLELKANPHLRARGVVIESKKTPGQGVVVTLLVQNGALHAGDIVLCGAYYGKVKAMLNYVGERVQEAPPSTPVEILGLQGVPEAGEEFFVVKDEKKAKTLSELKQNETRRKSIVTAQGVTLEDLYNRIKEGSIKELKIVLKADVQGSLEALGQSLQQLSTGEVKVNIIHSGVGNINESDVMLAMVSKAVVIGFNVKAEPQAEEVAKEKGIDVHIYGIIYEAIADVKAGLEGLLEPELREVFKGRAQILEVFTASKVGKAAGCMITKGSIHNKDRIRIRRGENIVYEGELSALKRFKDDVKDVKEGFECGMSFKNFNEIRKNDIIEAYIIEKVARRLEK